MNLNIGNIGVWGCGCPADTSAKGSPGGHYGNNSSHRDGDINENTTCGR